MATFKETRQILLASYASNITTIEEYALLFEQFKQLGFSML